MKIRFWGTRGSLPTSLTAHDIHSKLVAAIQAAQGKTFVDRNALDRFVATLGFDTAGTYGGHTSCVQLITDRPEHFIFDLGSGVRALGQHMLARVGHASPQTYHIFLSHLHWDHIMGLPFFTPAYIPGNQIIIHTGHANAEYALRRQQDQPSFPVDFDHFGADMKFVLHEPGQTQTVAGLTVDIKKQRHGGDSYGWRIDYQGQRAIYSTDSEHQIDDLDERESFVNFFRGANAVIFDAMYSLADAVSVKADWGHSSNIVGVEICKAAQVKKLFLFHHEPANSDAQITQIQQESSRYAEITPGNQPLEVIAAWDGLETAL